MKNKKIIPSLIFICLVFITLFNFIPLSNCEEVMFSFDFGLINSPIEENYIQQTGAIFNSVLGYGWSSAVSARDRTLPDDDLLRDFVQIEVSIFKNFSVVLPNGYYLITIISGDYSYAHDNLAVYLENNLKIENISCNVNEFNTYNVTTSVLDNVLNISFIENGGVTTASVVNSIVITNIEFFIDPITDNTFDNYLILIFSIILLFMNTLFLFFKHKCIEIISIHGIIMMISIIISITLLFPLNDIFGVFLGLYSVVTFIANILLMES